MNAPVSTSERVPPSSRKLRLRDFSEQMAPERHRWIERNAYFYEDDYRYMRFLVPEGSRVLDLGCGIGDLLARSMTARRHSRRCIPCAIGKRG
jgi:2-polyprenyl-3-methyl-5-hydroxy-6-metoxy-1,4-benzoquinol methylase